MEVGHEKRSRFRLRTSDASHAQTCTLLLREGVAEHGGGLKSELSLTDRTPHSPRVHVRLTKFRFKNVFETFEVCSVHFFLFPCCSRRLVQRGVARLRSTVVRLASSAAWTETFDGPMFQHQATLPRLPIPKLEDTCARYVRLLLLHFLH